MRADLVESFHNVDAGKTRDKIGAFAGPPSRKGYRRSANNYCVLPNAHRGRTSKGAEGGWPWPGQEKHFPNKGNVSGKEATGIERHARSRFGKLAALGIDRACLPPVRLPTAYARMKKPPHTQRRSGG